MSPPIQFDTANFITTVLGAFLGGLLGIAISYYFFIKGKAVAILTSWMANNLGEVLIRQMLPQFFNSASQNCNPTQPPPTDLDAPHLDIVIVNQTKTSSSQKLEILFRVSDEGWNFQMATGVSLIDMTGIRHAAKNSLFGYMQAEIPILLNQPAGNYTIGFEMRDAPKNGNLPKSNQQSIIVLLN